MKDIRSLWIHTKRLEKEISLEALAHGICSPSYLSKIEKGQVIASEDILQALLKKLGMVETIQTASRQKIDTFFSQFLAGTVDQSLVQKLLDDRKIYEYSAHTLYYQLFLLYIDKLSLDQVLPLEIYMNEQEKQLLKDYQLIQGQDELGQDDLLKTCFQLKVKADWYAEKGRLIQAYDLYQQAIGLANVHASPRIQAQYYAALGYLCLDIDFEQACLYYQQARSRDRGYTSLTRLNEAIVWLTQFHQPEKALICLAEVETSQQKERLSYVCLSELDRLDEARSLSIASEAPFCWQLDPKSNEYQLWLETHGQEDSLSNYLYQQWCKQTGHYKQLAQLLEKN